MLLENRLTLLIVLTKLVPIGDFTDETFLELHQPSIGKSVWSSA